MKTVLHPPCNPFTTASERVVRLEGIRYDITLTFGSPKLLAAVIHLRFEANSDSNKIHKSEIFGFIPKVVTAGLLDIV